MIVFDISKRSRINLTLYQKKNTKGGVGSKAFRKVLKMSDVQKQFCFVVLIFFVFGCSGSRGLTPKEAVAPPVNPPTTGPATGPTAQPTDLSQVQKSVTHPLQPLQQETSDQYKRPAPMIERLLTAMGPPEVVVHTASKKVALLYRQELVSLESLSRPFLGLAGFRVDPEIRMSRGAPMIERVEIVALEKDATPVVWQPKSGAVLEHVAFSPDGKRLSALQVKSDAVALVIFDIARRAATELAIDINPVWGIPCWWLDSETLLCRVIPEKQGAPPEQEPGPLVIEHPGGSAPTSTYSNLLTDSHDEALFEHYFAVELARVGLDGSSDRLPESRGLLSEITISANGRYAVVKHIKRPFSRIVQADRFPRDIEIWDLDKGEKLRKLPLPHDGAQPVVGFPEGPRHFAWRPDASNALGWVERDSTAPHGIADRWMVLEPPFNGAPRQMMRSEQTIRTFGWTTGGTPYFTTSTRQNREVRAYIARADRPELVWKGSVEDRESNPGKPIKTNGEQGAVLEFENRVFFSSDGFSKEGPQPFLDAFNLETMKTERVHTSSEGEIENVIAVLDGTGPKLLTKRETEIEPFNLRVVRGDKYETIWRCPHPYPDLTSIGRRYLHYRRRDGVELFGTLYLPAGYNGEGKLPTVVWIYPTQHTDTAYAEVPHERSHRFYRVKGPSPMIFPLAGYALLLNPSMPIIGDSKSANDRYISQLSASAEAAVQTLIKEGISDPERIAIAGRSYGAFSTANLLIHTRLFRTGIALSGAYNRTLTPFGFQNERRSFWKATDVYARMSPFYYADRIHSPILLIHGKADENAGTYPIQSTRFFHALIGNGAAARYVVLPHEGHTYHARESVLHIAAEMLQWLERTM
jgi:dipeptidyl aminopeptidase/acylaminoacyl peptidase